MKKIIFILLLLPLTVTALPTNPNFNGLTWDAPVNSPMPVTGYYVYCSTTSMNYSNADRVDVGNVTQGYLTNLNLVDGVTNYCVVTAYEAEGAESDFSNEFGFFMVNGQGQINVPAAPSNLRVF
jgi:hypothetical protein